MKKIALVMLLLLVGLTTFGKTKHKKKKKTTGNDITSVMMQRTPCFGHCPTYSIEITKDGLVTYNAMRFTADSGVFTKNISASKAKDVMDAFKTFRVDTCQDVYTNRVSDLPSIIYTIKYTNSTKTIRNANFGPAFLKQELAATMDDVGKKSETNTGWKKIADKSMGNR